MTLYAPMQLLLKGVFVSLSMTCLTVSAGSFEEGKQKQQSEFEVFKQQQTGASSPSVSKQQKNISETNISGTSSGNDAVDDLPLSDPFGKKKDYSNNKPGTPTTIKPADTWRPLKDAGNKAKDIYKSIGSPKHIRGPNGGHGGALTKEVADSTIGAPCDVGSSRCENGVRLICRSSLEGKRMAYWWENAGACGTTNISGTSSGESAVDDLPLADPFGKKKDYSNNKPGTPTTIKPAVKPADTWRPLKDAGNKAKDKAKDIYKSIGSPKHIRGPDGQDGGALTFPVSESTIGAPCDVGFSRCENGVRLICRSSLEGRRMAYWWEKSGSCNDVSINDEHSENIFPANKMYREIINYKSLYQNASQAVVLILANKANRLVSKGTGSIISRDGLVLTNAHVVDGAIGDIDVFLKPQKLQGNGADLSRNTSASIIAIDRNLDLALLKINTREALPMPLSLSDLLSFGVGEPTVAIGHPTGGAYWSLTTGRISAAFKNYNGINGKDVFQTETAMNPGNSGGPLLDGSGAIIGVNSFVRRVNNTGVVLEGLNFAIKSTSALRWIDSLSIGRTKQLASQERPAEINVADISRQQASHSFVTSQPAGREMGGKQLNNFLSRQQAAFDELNASE